MKKIKSTNLLLIFLAYNIFSVALCFGGENEAKKNDRELQKLINGKEGPMMIGMIQFELLKLGYFGCPQITGKMDKATETALRKYQGHRGLPITGKLNSRTFDKVLKDFDIIDPDPIAVSGYHFSDYIWETYFKADGTWVFESKIEKMADPIQRTEIQCYRDIGVCFEATAYISDNMLNVSNEVYDIERWDEYEIVTKPLDFGCVRYVLKIHRPNKTVRKFRSTLRTTDLCKGVDTTEKAIRLVDGFSEYWKSRRKRIDKRRDILSPNVKKLIESLKNQK